MERPWLLLGLLLLTGADAFAGEAWTLERAIDYALTHSPDARLAEQRIVAARATLSQANAAFWPQVQLQSSYLRTDHPVSVFGSVLNQRSFSPALDFNNVPDIDNANVRGLVSVPLYQGGRHVAARESAKANAAAARHNAEAVLNTLSFEVARAFHTVLKTQEFIRAAEASVRSFDGNLAMANQRLNAGTLLKTDVLDVEVRLAQSREDLARARHAEALARRALRNLLGIDQGDFEVIESTRTEPGPQSGDFSSRPELAAASQLRHAAAASVRREQGGYQPSVSAFTSLDYDAGTKFDGSGKSYTAGLLLRWDLWDGGRARAKVAEARAQAESAREEERKLRLALDLELEQARLSLKDAGERLSVTEKVIGQAAESLELTRARFSQGLALATQLIDAEAALTGARVRRAEAEADQRIAVAALHKALGLSQVNVRSKRP